MTDMTYEMGTDTIICARSTMDLEIMVLDTQQKCRKVKTVECLLPFSPESFVFPFANLKT